MKARPPVMPIFLVVGDSRPAKNDFKPSLRPAITVRIMIAVDEHV